MQQGRASGLLFLHLFMHFVTFEPSQGKFPQISYSRLPQQFSPCARALILIFSLFLLPNSRFIALFNFSLLKLNPNIENSKRRTPPLLVVVSAQGIFLSSIPLLFPSARRMNKLWSSSGEQVRGRWSFVLSAILSDISRWRIRGGIYNQTIITQSIFPYRRGPARPCILPSDCGIWCCHNGVVRRRDKQAAEFSSEQGFAITRSVLFGAGRAEMVGDPASAQSISDTGTAGKGTYCTEDARERRDDEVYIIIRSYHHATFSFSPSFPVPKSKQESTTPKSTRHSTNEEKPRAASQYK